MTIQKRLQADLVEALRKTDVVTLAGIRYIKSKIESEMDSIQAKANKGKPQEDYVKVDTLPDTKVIEIIKTLIKQNKDFLQEYNITSGDQFVKKNNEIGVYQRYLPPTMTEDEIRGIIADKIETVKTPQMLFPIINKIATEKGLIVDNLLVKQIIATIKK